MQYLQVFPSLQTKSKYQIWSTDKQPQNWSAAWDGLAGTKKKKSTLETKSRFKQTSFKYILSLQASGFSCVSSSSNPPSEIVWQVGQHSQLTNIFCPFWLLLWQFLQVEDAMGNKLSDVLQVFEVGIVHKWCTEMLGKKLWIIILVDQTCVASNLMTYLPVWKEHLQFSTNQLKY